uniref:enoyl-CoA hydratase n=1 Tax=Rhodococcus hoagii TaxID=43767 RepID=UPI00111BE964|nr:enoyl-CoA hydratase [Prescottella equi]
MMAIIALDNGPWCFAWLVGRGRPASGVRAQFLRREAGETYPTFTLATGAS